MTRTRGVAVALVLVLLAGILAITRGGEEDRTAVVYLPRAVHLYAGSDVVVLGVRVGEVTSVDPDGDRVRVGIRYDGAQKLPADVQAALVSPTLVADRYVQLTPVYDGGPVLADGGTIPLARGQVPVELDEIFASLHELTTALGPDGANSKGALADLVAVGADNLRDNGAAAGQALEGASQLSDTLARNRTQLFGTVRSLQLFTTELAQHDAQVRRFSDDLATVSAQLAGERESLGEALGSLAVTLAKLTGFVRDNRASLVANVRDLEQVAAALHDEKTALGELLEIAPTGISNFTHLYNPQSRALNGRINGESIYEDPTVFACSLFVSLGQDPEDCRDLIAPMLGAPVPQPDRSLAGVLDGGAR